jgi:hypothetical protein
MCICLLVFTYREIYSRSVGHERRGIHGEMRRKGGKGRRGQGRRGIRVEEGKRDKVAGHT